MPAGIRRMKKQDLRTTLVVLTLLLLLAVPLGNAGLALLGRIVSPGSRGGEVASLWPMQGDFVASLTPELRWPDVEGDRYRVTIEKLGSSTPPQRVLRKWVGGSSVVVPDHILRPESDYRWQVERLLGSEATLLHQEEFSTRTWVEDGALRVTPAVIAIAPERMGDLVRMTLSVPREVDVTVELPESLAVAGSRKVFSTGPVAIEAVVTPSVAFLKPLKGRGVLGDVRIVTSQGDRLVLPVRYGLGESGNWVRSVRFGFDPVLDAPAFGNFARGWLATATNGTCLGMVLATERAFRDYRSCRRDQEVCLRLREATLLDAEGWKEQMNYLHSANLDPEQWRDVLSTALSPSDMNRLEEEIMGRFVEDELVPMALMPEGRNEVDAPGHAVLVWAVHEFERVSLLFLYDPNHIYQDAGSLGPVLLMDKETVPPAVRLVDGSHSEAVVAFPIGVSKLVQRFSGLLSQPYNRLDEWMATWAQGARY